MGYAGPKAVSKVNMILKDKSCDLPKLNLGNPLKKKHKGESMRYSSKIYKRGCKKKSY